MQDVHGGDSYRNRVDYDFSININPLGMPENSRRAAQEGLLLSEKYPDCRGEELCLAIAEKESVRAEQVVLGNGAAELIYAVCFAEQVKKAVVAVPSFAEYEAAVSAAGGEVLAWELQEQENFVLTEEICSVLTDETDILFLCNPNNPTGNRITKEVLCRIAEECEEKGIRLCVDECFLPFLEEEEQLTMKQEMEKYPHLFVLRAFTKVYGMPGLRLGYGLTADKAFLERLAKVLPPWNTSLPAQLAGIAALQETDYLIRTRELVRKEKAFLREELRNGLAEKIYESAADFLFFKSRENLKELLLKQGILIRSCENFRGLSKGYFRIGIKTHEENEELIRRWRTAEKERKTEWQKQS